MATLTLKESLIYNGVLWPVGTVLTIRDEDAPILSCFGTLADDGKTVKSGEKSCVERDESDANADSHIIPAKKQGAARKNERML